VTVGRASCFSCVFLFDVSSELRCVAVRCGVLQCVVVCLQWRWKGPPVSPEFISWILTICCSCIHIFDQSNVLQCAQVCLQWQWKGLAVSPVSLSSISAMCYSVFVCCSSG